jgi:hypothetical protein
MLILYTAKLADLEIPQVLALYARIDPLSSLLSQSLIDQSALFEGPWHLCSR